MKAVISSSTFNYITFHFCEIWKPVLISLTRPLSLNIFFSRMRLSVCMSLFVCVCGCGCIHVSVYVLYWSVCVHACVYSSIQSLLEIWRFEAPQTTVMWTSESVLSLCLRLYSDFLASSREEISKDCHLVLSTVPPSAPLSVCFSPSVLVYVVRRDTSWGFSELTCGKRSCLDVTVERTKVCHSLSTK